MMKQTPLKCESILKHQCMNMHYFKYFTFYVYRDCLRFSFMNVLQKELDDIKTMWNTHLMRSARSSMPVRGITDELYYIPEIQGINFFCTLLFFTAYTPML